MLLCNVKSKHKDGGPQEPLTLRDHLRLLTDWAVVDVAKATCALSYCDTPTRALGYCMYHYRQRAAGRPFTPHKRRRPRGSAAQRDEFGRKQCARCEEWRPAAEYRAAENTQDGLQSWCSPCSSDYMRLRRYGFTTEEVLARLERQGGCAICGTSVEPAGFRNGWHVDHDHSCCPGDVACPRCIRGILCARCNKLIGLAGDSAAVLTRAIGYLNGEVAPRAV